MADLGTPTHPTGDAVAACRELLAAVSEAPVHLLDRKSKEAQLRDLVALEAQTTQLRLRLLAASGDVAEFHGHRDAGAWLAHQTNLEPSRVRTDQTVALAIDERWARVGTAMATGALTPDQARVIVRGLDDLAAHPDRVGVEVLDRAECELIDYATGHHRDAPDQGFSPRQLRTLAQRILHVVAPEIADEEDARHLEQLEEQARWKIRLSITPIGDGITRISGLVPDHIGIRLSTYLDAFTNPRHDTTDSGTATTGIESPRVPRPRALGQAFCALLERLDQQLLPTHGGDTTTVILTMELDKLLADLGTAEILAGGDDSTLETRLSPSQVRRLACNAHLVPAVLGTDGEVLDLGRTTRLFSPAQRRAMRLRDQTCRAEGCTIPATWCEAHHDTPWSKGGRTDLADGVTLCSHHHHREHDPAYRTLKLPNGDRRYHRRR